MNGRKRRRRRRKRQTPPSFFALMKERRKRKKVGVDLQKTCLLAVVVVFLIPSVLFLCISTKH